MLRPMYSAKYIFICFYFLCSFHTDVLDKAEKGLYNKDEIHKLG